jgi:hypothetical protein
MTHGRRDDVLVILNHRVERNLFFAPAPATLILLTRFVNTFFARPLEKYAAPTQCRSTRKKTRAIPIP